ncbi:hypothetical protein AB4Z52_27725 [Rhizobium sp. 2YAF20]|uniref:hypothetical protein n=1 Tax=Rhizobium sp. 2YAF20 TaxID=3233027 RepID=UPI003F9C27CB
MQLRRHPLLKRAVYYLFYSVAEAGFVLPPHMAMQHVKYFRTGELADGALLQLEFLETSFRSSGGVAA